MPKTYSDCFGTIYEGDLIVHAEDATKDAIEALNETFFMYGVTKLQPGDYLAVAIQQYVHKVLRNAQPKRAPGRPQTKPDGSFKI